MAAPGQGRLYGSFYDDGDFQLATGDCHFWPPPTTFIRPPAYTFARPGTTVRIVVAEQQTAILAMSDAHHIRTEQRGRSNVVRVRVRVDQVRDLAGHAVGMRHR